MIKTLIWLGDKLIPGALVLFWMVGLSIVVAGMQLLNTLKLPSICLDGPITKPDATPIATPALSPLLNGVTVARLWSGIAQVN